jgi:hypothetical protein
MEVQLNKTFIIKYTEEELELHINSIWLQVKVALDFQIIHR